MGKAYSIRKVGGGVKQNTEKKKKLVLVSCPHSATQPSFHRESALRKTLCHQDTEEHLQSSNALLLEVFTLLHEFLWILPDSQWKVRIPWNFYGKHLAGASAICVFISMEIPTFFWGVLTEMVGIKKPLGMIPNGIHEIPLEFCWNSALIPWETTL